MARILLLAAACLAKMLTCRRFLWCTGVRSESAPGLPRLLSHGRKHCAVQSGAGLLRGCKLSGSLLGLSVGSLWSAKGSCWLRTVTCSEALTDLLSLILDLVLVCSSGGRPAVPLFSPCLPVTVTCERAAIWCGSLTAASLGL